MRSISTICCCARRVCFVNAARSAKNGKRRFQYIHVDEYQDTNRVQYELLRLLTGPKQNVCVVGDEDQSIYRWRGADVSILLSFSRDFPDARVVKLERNYRSTQNILDAAGAVVANNPDRLGKSSARENGAGANLRILKRATRRPKPNLSPVNWNAF